MSERGFQNEDGLYVPNTEAMAECQELGTHVWVRSLLITYRTAFPLTERERTKYYRDEESVYWCLSCGHSLRERTREAVSLAARDYFAEIAPYAGSCRGVDPKHIFGWNYAPGHDDPHLDWDRDGFMAGGWTR
jgi:hypothetical protein